MNTPKAQRSPPPPSLDGIAARKPDRDEATDEATVAAHASGGYS